MEDGEEEEEDGERAGGREGARERGIEGEIGRERERERERKGDQRCMALRLRRTTCGGRLCTIEVEVGLGVWHCSSAHPLVGVPCGTIEDEVGLGVWRCSSAGPCAASKLRLALQSQERERERERGREGGRSSAYGTAAPHIHVWGLFCAPSNLRLREIIGVWYCSSAGAH